jgi:hypothetical protein
MRWTGHVAYVEDKYIQDFCYGNIEETDLATDGRIILKSMDNK